MSAAEVKDLAYYETRPGELGELSVDQIEALYASSGSDDSTGEDGGESNGENVDPVDNGAIRDESVTPASTAQQTADDKADGVLAKDGKSVIPFTVLEGARRRATELEEIVRQQNEQIAALASQQKTGNPPEQVQQTGDLSVSAIDIDDETIAAYEEELPGFAKVLRAAKANQQVIQQLTAKVEELSSRDAKKAEGVVRNEVQDAIDSIPVLAHLQATDPEAWAEVVALDDSMRNMPKFQGMSMQERFVKVAAAYQAATGPIEIPKTTQTKDLAKVADRVIAESTGKSRPVSLSDLPGGATPPVDELAAFENTSTADLGAQLERMSDDQQQAYLARLGLL